MTYKPNREGVGIVLHFTRREIQEVADYLNTDPAYEIYGD